MPDMVGTGVYLKSETMAALDEWAQDEGRSRNNLIQRICDEALQRRISTLRLARAVREIKPVPDGNVTPGEGWGYPVADEG